MNRRLHYQSRGLDSEDEVPSSAHAVERPPRWAIRNHGDGTSCGHAMLCAESRKDQL